MGLNITSVVYLDSDEFEWDAEIGICFRIRTWVKSKCKCRIKYLNAPVVNWTVVVSVGYYYGCLLLYINTKSIALLRSGKEGGSPLDFD